MRTLVAFIIGAISGTVGGLLFAPKKGEDLRKEAKDQLSNQLDDIEKTFHKNSEMVKKEYNNRLNKLIGKGHEVIDQVSEKAKLEKS